MDGLFGYGVIYIYIYIYILWINVCILARFYLFCFSRRSGLLRATVQLPRIWKVGRYSMHPSQ